MRTLTTIIIGLVLFSLTACSSGKADQNTVPRWVDLIEFNKTPLQCDEIVNSLSKISETKKNTVYKYKATFVDRKFRAEYHIMNNPSDIAISTYLGDGKKMFVILTNDLPTYEHLRVGLGD